MWTRQTSEQALIQQIISEQHRREEVRGQSALKIVSCLSVFGSNVVFIFCHLQLSQLKVNWSAPPCEEATQRTVHQSTTLWLRSGTKKCCGSPCWTKLEGTRNYSNMEPLLMRSKAACELIRTPCAWLGLNSSLRCRNLTETQQVS